MPKLIKPITKWIDWPDDPEAAVEIRAFTDEDTAAIRAAALRQKSTMVNGKAEMVVEYEVHRDREETARRRVVDWHGFNDENGRPMACTEGKPAALVVQPRLYGADQSGRRRSRRPGRRRQR
jgi:hypothetical protein